MKGITRFSVIAGALAGVICSGALEAVAQEPIIGCVKQGTGLLRIPPGGEGCKTDETPLGFNDLPALVALANEVGRLRTQLDLLQACVGDTLPECNPPPPIP
jgi:hypothetical protein